MKNVTPLELPFHTKKLFLLLIVLVTFLCGTTTTAQINYSESFTTNLGGWSGGSAALPFVRYTGSTSCDGASAYSDYWSGDPIGDIRSPLIGTYNGGAMSMSFDYKLCNYTTTPSTDNTIATQNPWGLFNVQYGATPTGPWTTFATIDATNHTPSSTCSTVTVTLAPPTGALYINFNVVQSGLADFWLTYDNIVLTETSPACTGAPVAGTISPSTTTICDNTTATFTVSGTSVGSGSGFQWIESSTATGPWVAAPVTPGMTATSYTTASMTGPVTKYYRMVRTCSASPTLTDSTASAMLQVNASPALVASASDSTVCAGDSTVLTASGANSYVWNPGSLSGPVQTVTPTANTVYTVTGTDTASGCTAVVSIPISSRPPFYDTARASMDSICIGQSVNLIAADSMPPSVIPPYCNSGSTNGIDTKIDSTNINGVITFTAGSPNGPQESYTNYTSVIVNVTAGTAFPLYIDKGDHDGAGAPPGLPTGPYAAYVKVFIDIDQSGTFDSGELFYSFAAPSAEGSIPATNILIPATAKSGHTRMRIVLREGGTATTTVACGGYDYGETEDYTLNIIGGVSAPYTFSWMPGNLIGAAQTVTPSVTTVYVATQTDSNGCTAQDSVKVYVHPKSIVASPSAQAICAGAAPVQITAAGGTAYTWTPTTGLTLNANGDTVMASPTTTTTYTVSATDTNGCMATDSSVVTVNAALQIDSLVSRPTTICAGGDATLLAYPGIAVASAYCASNATLSADTKIDTVAFAGVSTGTAPSSGTQTYTDNTVTIIPVSAGTTYPLSIANGTAGSHYSAFVKAFIDYDQSGTFEPSEEVYSFGSTTAVNTIPATNITIPLTAFNGTTRMRVVLRESGSASSTQACGTYSYGETEDYTVNISGGATKPEGFASIAWSPTASLNTASGDSVIAQGLTTTTLFTAIGTALNGCKDTGTINVVITPNPAVTATAAANPICQGDSTELSAGGADTYVWSPSALTTDKITVMPTATTTYTVTGTDTTTGCIADASVTLVVSQPLVKDSVTASPDSICAGETTMLAANFKQTKTFNTFSFASTTGATLNPMTTSTTAVISGSDDVYTSGHTIGFNFDYNGTAYTTFGTSSNGFMVLGGVGGSSDLGNGFGTSTLAANLPLIAPWWDDCHTRNDSISYTTIGTAPNRTLIVDFGLAIRFSAPTANTQMQVWLHETTNEIEFVYGASTALNTPSGSVGLTSATTTAEMQSVNTDNNTSSTTTASNSNTVFPTSGTKYSFTPPATATISYAWTPTTDVVSPAMAMTATNPLTTNTNFKLSVTNGTTGCVVTDSVMVVVGAKPTLAVTATPGLSVCLGDTITLMSGATNYNTLTWNGVTTAGTDTVLAPAVSGTYTVIATDTTSGCSASDSVVVMANTPVTIDSLVSTPSTICAGGDATILAYPGLAVASAYCASNATLSADTKIDTVAFAGVSTGTAPSSGTQTYTDNTATVIPVTAGTTYPLSIANGTAGSHYSSFVKAFIDYDQSGTFEPSEEVYSFGSTTGINTIPATTVAVPLSAFNGTTRMRVVLRESGSASSTQACGTYSYGETEDYTVNISGGATKPAGFASITWSPAANLNTASGDSVVAQGLTATTLFTAIGTDPNGCMDTATINVVITPKPTVTATASANPICPGDSTVLTATGANTFSWSPGPLVGSSITVMPAATTSYIVTGTDTTTGCTSDATVTIAVSTPLVKDSVTASPDSICSGNTSMLAANFTQAKTFNTYSFAASTGATLNPMTTSTTAVGSNEDDTYTSGHTIGFNFDYNGTTYTTFGTSSNGFMVLGGVGGNSDLSNGFGTSTLAANLPLIAPWWDDCHTKNDSISYTTIGTAPNRTLVVNFGLAVRFLSATANTEMQVWLHETTNEIELVYGASTALNSPSGNVGLTSATTTAEMQSVNTDNNTSSNSIASNSNTAFPASGTKYTFTPPATTTISYAWTPTTDVVSPAAAMTATNALTATTNFIVSATDGTSGCVTKDSVMVTVGTIPTLAITALPNDTVCAGDTVMLMSGATGASTYTWNGVMTAGADTTLTPATAGVYTVVATSAAGCSATDSITISISSPSITSVTASPTTVCDSGNTTLAVLPGLAGATIPYCASGATSAFDTKIDTVSFAGVTVGSSPSTGETYTDNTATVIPVTAGTTYPLAVRNGSASNTYYGGQLWVYIDYNQNNVFDASEMVYNFNTTALNSIPATTVAIPTTALNGTTRMRFIFPESSTLQPCGTWTYGETEDYTVNITGGVAPAAPFASVLWTPSTYLDTTTLATVNAMGMTAATTYTVTGTDAAGCTVSSTITVNVNPAVVGNKFSNPIVVPSYPYADTNNNLSDNCWTDAGSFTGNRASNDVFYQFTLAGCNDSINATLCNSATNWDTYMHLLDSTGTRVAFDDDDCGVRSTINQGGLTPGGKYYIVVEGFGASNQDTFVVNINGFDGAVSDSLAPVTSAESLNQADGSIVNYHDANCNLILTVDDGAGGNVLGVTASSVTVDATASFHNGQPYVRRWYQITPTSNGAANVMLYINQSDFDNYNSVVASPYDSLPSSGSNTDPHIANITVTKNDNAGLGSNPIVLTPTSVNWNGNYWVITVATPGFSQFRVHAANPNNAALSVAYKTFTVTKESTTDVVEWTTVSESNNSHFNVQRSADGSIFETLGTVNSKAVNGTSNRELNYTFVDATPQIGHNYYRLEQVDMDTKTSYTKTIDIIWGAQGSIVSIYPNPTSDYINIDLSTDKVSQTEIKLLDMSGRVVKSVMAQTIKGLNNIKLDMTEVAAGVYGVQIYENNKLTHVSKVRKN